MRKKSEDRSQKTEDRSRKLSFNGHWMVIKLPWNYNNRQQPTTIYNN